VDAALRDSGVEPRRMPGIFIARPEKPYVVFTPFWRAWSRVPRRGVNGAPRNVPVPTRLAAGPIPHVRSELPDPLPAGETEARRRMRAFDPHGYAARHDRVAGGTSTLSPYLHFGCLSARELELRVPEPALRRQLAWRDFYAQVLLHHPQNVRRAFRPELDAIEWTGGDEEFAAWREGRTGFPLVDAGMRQLAATGWMHNRARLVAASFLAKDLHVDWRRGEAHFMRLLLDGDVAQNNGNWQWVASVGVDPAPMQRRLYNPELQRRRHDPDEEYVRRWIPELGDGYPEPIVDHAVERRAAIAAYRAAKL
jgi:deoxyribodipyrimidine photo-lyase